MWPLDYTRLLPRVTLYLHVHRDTVDDLVAKAGAGARRGTGVVRWEGHSPVTAEYVRDFLGPHAAFTIKPVIDLAGQVPVDGYEIPDRLREAVHLRTPADVFPYASATGRGLDYDHTTPYRHPADQPGLRDLDGGHVQDGPGTAGRSTPGQTGMANLGKLTRLHHRVKTHTAWQARQPFPGIYLWRSPHGRYFLVDHTGTHRLGTDPTAAAAVPASGPDTCQTGGPHPAITSPRDLGHLSLLEDQLANQLLDHTAA